MRWACVAIICIALWGCATQSGATFGAAKLDPTAACLSDSQRLAFHDGVVARYVDRKLSDRVWFNSRVVGFTFLDSGDSTSSGGLVTCSAALRLENGTKVPGEFAILYNLAVAPLYDFAGLAEPQTVLSWSTDPVWARHATRSYWIKKIGKQTYERRRRAYQKWLACAMAPHGLTPEGLADTPYDIPAWALKEELSDARTEAILQACGVPKYSPRGGW